jgi:hypothetical protein
MTSAIKACGAITATPAEMEIHEKMLIIPHV